MRPRGWCLAIALATLGGRATAQQPPPPPTGAPFDAAKVPAGLAPPCWPVKLKLAALKPITGGIDVTVRLTAIVCGVLLAPGADTVTVPL